jgi:hypothetical protein
MKNNWIVITSINLPTLAIERISELCNGSQWNCVVVGDTKTPSNWACKNITFLDIQDQKNIFSKFTNKLPFNHYSRKNVGYLYAISEGADLILDTDDDNIPLDNFGKNISREITGKLIGNAKWINTYKYFTKDQYIWPRGNPLNTIHEIGEVLNDSIKNSCPIQQFLADGEPDVDAIYRLIFNRNLFFEENSSVILDKKSYCSFNSQNTIFYKEVFPLLYLPSFVSFRMTDIWRSFVAQNILWSLDKRLCFSSSTVRQVRNDHNLIKDFNEEIVGYTSNENIVNVLDTLQSSWTHETDLLTKIWDSWKILYDHKFIVTDEMELVEEWLNILRIK